MTTRRANDAQIDRLLRAIGRPEGKPGLSDYGKQLARKIASQDKIAYRSAERRLQRYITTAGERRSFASAPKRYQTELRAVGRATPLPSPPAPPIRERPFFPEPTIERRVEREIERVEREAEYAPGPEDHTDLYELNAIIAYFDGDIYETADRLGVRPQVLDLATQGIMVSRRGTLGQIDQGVETLYGELEHADIQDITDFSDLLHNLADWEIKMILDDIASGNTTFADWMDAFRADDMMAPDDPDLEDSEFWALWREAYKRSK